MAIKLFVLGSPGSGKSTVCRHIVKYVQEQPKDLSAKHINDYDILYQMFRDYKDDSEQKRFIATAHDGFVVLDYAVYNDALKDVEKEINAIEQGHLVVAEFARTNYEEAFQQFSRSLVEDSYFLFLDVNHSVCAQRVHERVDHPTTRDDHFVSDFTLEAFLYKDSKQYILSQLALGYRIEGHRIKVIQNNGAFSDICDTLDRFVTSILK